MKKIFTWELVIFSIVVAIVNLVFMYFLDTSITTQNPSTLTISFVVSVLVLFAFGCYLWWKEEDVWDYWLRFDIASFIVVCIVSFLWVKFYPGTNLSLSTFYTWALVWVWVIIVHSIVAMLLGQKTLSPKKIGSFLPIFLIFSN